MILNISKLLQGNTEQHQITLIAQLCGTITTEVWEGVDRLELFNKMEIPKVRGNSGKSMLWCS